MLISLLTDFGTKDYFVGAMKGVILSINSEAKIVDITHQVEAQNIRSAGFILAACYRDFPEKTIFVTVVDPGVGSDRQAVLVETEKYYFIAPDNGLLSLVLANEKKYRVFELTRQKYFREFRSLTFHGRDIFAPVAAWLSKGIEPKEFGRELKDLVCLDISFPKTISETELEAEIIHIDHFGNLITNLKKNDLSKVFSLEVNGIELGKHHSFYAEAEKDEIFTIWGSARYLEIVANQNSAKDLIKIAVGDKILVKLQ